MIKAAVVDIIKTEKGAHIIDMNIRIAARIVIEGMDILRIEGEITDKAWKNIFFQIERHTHGRNVSLKIIPDHKTYLKNFWLKTCIQPMTMDTLSSSRSSIVYLWHSHVDPDRHMYLHLIIIGAIILSITIITVFCQLKIELAMKMYCNKQNVCVRIGHHDLFQKCTQNIVLMRVFCHTTERDNVTVYGLLRMSYGYCIVIDGSMCIHSRFGCTEKWCVSYGGAHFIVIMFSIQMMVLSYVDCSNHYMSECILNITIYLINFVSYVLMTSSCNERKIVRLRSDGRLISCDEFDSFHKNRNHRILHELLTYTFKWTFSFNDLLFCCLVMCVSYCVNPSSVDADNFIFIDYDLILILFYNRWIKYHCLAISFYTQPLTSPRIGSIKPCIYYTVLERLDQPTQMPTDKCDFGNPPKETHLCENTLIKNLNAYDERENSELTTTVKNHGAAPRITT
eukprot:471088_1